uniref:Uncharacterized protein n=1 Tax=Gopherus evgoodei TaxID=1825980 RepID=A0A8C4XZ56_9SAUR
MKYLIRIRNQSHFKELHSISFLTSLFLSVFLDARTTKSQAIQLNGMVGGSVVFPFKVPPWVPVETIVWNSVTTLATFTPRKGKPAAVKVLDKRYIGRLRVLDHTYSLVISNLSMLDRGIYRAQINTEFTTTVTEYLLHVYSECGGGLLGGHLHQLTVELLVCGVGKHSWLCGGWVKIFCANCFLRENWVVE